MRNYSVKYWLEFWQDGDRVSAGNVRSLCFASTLVRRRIVTLSRDHKSVISEFQRLFTEQKPIIALPCNYSGNSLRQLYS